mmetsp:Transcript_40196/g.67401  ORF Transcript_40196/g.67401 Transcript_40196/m.67401 type:complete len:395 (-) Transcript_40196:44-1228(-)
MIDNKHSKKTVESTMNSSMHVAFSPPCLTLNPCSLVAYTCTIFPSSRRRIILTKKNPPRRCSLTNSRNVRANSRGLTNLTLGSTRVVAKATRTSGDVVETSEDDEERESLLLVAQDPRVRNLLQLRYEVLGYLVTGVPDGAMAAQLLQNFKHPDLVVIDSNLPQLDGYSVFLSLRQLADVAYMVLLSSEELLTAQVELGAALYVVKPYTPLELQARTERALLLARHSIPKPQERENANSIIVGRVVINMQRQQVYKDGAKVHLTRMEYTLLEYLALRTDAKPVSIKNLKEYVYRKEIGMGEETALKIKELEGQSLDSSEQTSKRERVVDDESAVQQNADASEMDTRTISVHIHKLRAKLEDDPKKPSLILTKFDKETKAYGYTLTTRIPIMCRW